MATDSHPERPEPTRHVPVLAAAFGVVLLSGALALALPRENAPAPRKARPIAALPPHPVTAQPAARTGEAPFLAWFFPSPPSIAPRTSPPSAESPPPAETSVAPVLATALPPAKPTPPAATRPLAPAPVARIAVKRRVKRTEAELIKQVMKAPALALDRTADQAESAAAIQLTKRALKAGRGNTDPTLALLDRRPDLAGLPLRRGEACRLAPDDADHLDACSKALRGMTRDAGILRKQLTRPGPWASTWLQADTVPALMQSLMAEGAAVREVLVEQLARIDGRRATEALAQVALFDLHPRVREDALAALATRFPGDYRAAVLGGLVHPWPPVVDHAAEAAVALKMKDIVPALKKLLDGPDPRAPYRKPGGRAVYVKELVRVNHLMNCLLCHPPSFDATDKARREVPPIREPAETRPAGIGYGIGAGIGYDIGARNPGWLLLQPDTFVRADITYLKQDFSVMLPVPRPGPGPAEQRFDYFVRERLATERDLRKHIARRQAGPSEQHKAVRFALRELTGPK